MVIDSTYLMLKDSVVSSAQSRDAATQSNSTIYLSCFTTVDTTQPNVFTLVYVQSLYRINSPVISLHAYLLKKKSKKKNKAIECLVDEEMV